MDTSNGEEEGFEKIKYSKKYCLTVKFIILLFMIDKLLQNLKYFSEQFNL
jgi:hypothetical protein